MTATPQHVSSFPTIPAGQLRIGDLIHNPGHGAATYVLVARVAMADGVVYLMIYDSAYPDGTPASYRPQDRVLLACRDLIEPDGVIRAWTDASWRRAYRRGAAFALMDQIHPRSIGLPPITGADAEIDRLRGRDPIPPRDVPVAPLLGLVAGQYRDGPPGRGRAVSAHASRPDPPPRRTRRFHRRTRDVQPADPILSPHESTRRDSFRDHHPDPPVHTHRTDTGPIRPANPAGDRLAPSPAGRAGRAGRTPYRPCARRCACLRQHAFAP